MVPARLDEVVDVDPSASKIRSPQKTST